MIDYKERLLEVHFNHFHHPMSAATSTLPWLYHERINGLENGKLSEVAILPRRTDISGRLLRSIPVPKGRTCSEEDTT